MVYKNKWKPEQQKIIKNNGNNVNEQMEHKKLTVEEKETRKRKNMEQRKQFEKFSP